MPLPLPSLLSKSHKTLFSIPISLKPSQSESDNKHLISRKFTQISGGTLDDSGVLSQNFMSYTALGRDYGQSSDVNRQQSVLQTQSPDDRSTAYPRARLLDRALDAQNDKLQASLLSDDEDAEALSPITFAPNPASSGSRWSVYEAITQEWYSPRSQIPPDLKVASFLQTPMPAISPSRKEWLRRRRSSSAGDLPAWSDDLDRMKEDLNNKEKAINVRRAQKMEKLFGIPPPQTLYHTRHSPSPSVLPGTHLKRSKSPKSSFRPPGEPLYQQLIPNQSINNKGSKKADRPDTAESSAKLLPNDADCNSYDPVLRSSLVYNHYQHSLKSLGDILDRDDRESLAELHQYLSDLDGTTSAGPLLSPVCKTSMMGDRRLSNASSIKSERRHSLPAPTSMLSIGSEYSITTPKPDLSDFQVRRRRAAKLTHFFGVDYRELFNDVLESLEAGLEHEHKRGTLRAEEFEDLLERLRKIKTSRRGFF